MQKSRFFLVYFSLIISVQYVGAARILGLFPLNGKSHFVMFEEVMKRLADKGHRVDVLSPFPQKIPYPNYTDISIADSVPVVVNNISYEFMQTFAGVASTKAFIDLTGNKVCDLLEIPKLQKLIKNPPNDPPYDLLVVELFYANCYLAFGRHLNVPMVAMTSSPMLPYTNEPLGNPLNTAYVSELEDGSVSHMTFWSRFKNTIMTWIMSYESRYHTEMQDNILRKYFGPEMPGVRQLERDISLLLVNSHHTLNGIRPMTPAVVEVGGLHVRDNGPKLDENVKKWLDGSENGFIYVSFGSMVRIESFPETMLRGMYGAFAKISPVRVLMKVAKPESLPSGLPSNVLTSNWVSQVEVLKHKNIRAFVTHGGLMGIQEAVTFAVPLIGFPLFRDQPINIKNCADKGTALLLDYRSSTEETFLAALNEIIHNPKYKKNMIDLSTRFLDRPMKALDAAVFWVEYILRHGAHSLRSPAVALSWWQLALLDVYGSIIVAVLTTIYLLKLLVVKISSKISYRSKRLTKKNK